MITSPLIENIQCFYNTEMTCTVITIYDRDFITPFGTEILPPSFCGMIICKRGTLNVARGKQTYEMSSMMALPITSWQSCKLPSWGEKHILIFYVDPDRHKEAFTYELEENRRASSPKIESFGVLNLKDTKLPKGIIRSMARKRTAKNGKVGKIRIPTMGSIDY